MMELETLLFSRDRVSVAPLKQKVASDNGLLRRFGDLPVDRCDDAQVPPRRKPRAQERLETGQLRVLSKEAQEQASGDLGSVYVPGSDQKPLGQEALRRVRVEIKRVAKDTDPHPGIDIYPTEDLQFWKAVMAGPQGTPYEGGVFELYISLPSDYPTAPPEIRFATPILHCNVSAHGRICHAGLGRNWSADRTIRESLQLVYGLLLTPELEDPLDQPLSLQARTEPTKYRNAVKAHVTRNASKKTREELRNDLEK